jgi:exodeoxyribonuclease-3
MRIVSWNVNGLRAALKKGFQDYIDTSKADIYCLQETRALPDQLVLSVPGYTLHWNPAEKKGYSGTLVMSRLPFLSVNRGMGIAEHDREGRVLTVEMEEVFLVTVYTPNAQRGLKRLAYRTESWDVAFRNHLKSLEKKKPVVFCGDLNVAHKEIDLANPAANRKNAGFTDAERASFDALLDAGFIDTFRVFCSEGGHYTWWSNFGKARDRNVGWRIDYFGISQSLESKLNRAEIHPEVMGSDHCPISIDIDVR